MQSFSWKVFLLVIHIVMTTGVENVTDPKVTGRSRHHKAFFGDSGEVDEEVKTIFPDSASFSNEDEDEGTLKFAQDDHDQPGRSDFDAEKTIDTILAAMTSRAGRQLDLDKLDEQQLNEVISDPAIKEQLEAGNESEARGIIRDKLCALGLMSCHQRPNHRPHRPYPSHQVAHFQPTHHQLPHFEQPHHQLPHFDQPHYGQGIGHLHGGSIPPRDVSLVQPVAVQPVGGPISAVPLGHGHGHGGHVHAPLINKPYHIKPPPYGGYAKQGYVPPPPGPPGPIYSRPPVPPYVPQKHIYPSPQLFSEPITQPILPIEKKLVEVVHHHVHHKGQVPSSVAEYGVIGSQLAGAEEYYGSAQKHVVAVANPSGLVLKSPNYLGSASHARTCICVPIEQCILDGQEKSSELEIEASHGNDVIQGTGIPNSGLVGYGIDPRNRGRSIGIESNETDRSTEATLEMTTTTTTVPTVDVTNSTRSKRSFNATEPKPKGRAQPRRLDNGAGCRIRSIGSICCDPSRVRNPLQRQIPVGQLNAASNSFNQFLYNSNGLGAGATPYYGQCGKRNAQGGLHGRVITAAANSLTEGDTDFGEYPWQVAVLKKDGTFVCGGSVIDGHHVMTAAHGIKHLKATDLRVRLGEWDVNHNTEFYPHFERQVVMVTVHPDFYAGNLNNDIAILRFEGGVDFRQFPHVSPVCVAPQGTNVAGKRCFVTGWGKDSFGKGGKYQNVLKEIDLPILSNLDCEQKLKRTRLGPDFVLNPGFLCAGGEAGKDACKGDGGGPLVCEIHPGSWAQVGIVSWGVGCGERDVPGVYVAVEHYQPWIQHVTAGAM